MSRTWCLLVFLAFLPIGEAASNYFHLDGNFTCNLNRPFSYQITVMELDAITGELSDDDHIGGGSWVTANTSPARYYVEAVDYHDGPFWNYYFEVGFVILHDCGPQQMKYHVRIGDFWISLVNHVHKRTTNIDLTNKGWDNTYPY